MRGADGLLVGDCKTGADAIALDVAITWDIVPTVVKADWEKYGKGAGPIRNAKMAKEAAMAREEGFDVCCHAFPLGESRGTRGCVEELRKVGQKVTVHEVVQEPQERLF